MKKILLFLLFIIVFSGCSTPFDKKLKISVNTWIGYSPIFYAYDKGWLKPYNIEVIHLVSLAESMHLYAAGSADAMTGTQYEFHTLKDNHPSLTPLMLFDRSNGGDMILSNQSIEDLLKSRDTIDVYLEIDSVNIELIKDFLKFYNIDQRKLTFHNSDQVVISKLKLKAHKKPTLIVTYTPYNIALEKEGFRVVASTKNRNVVTVIDALYATQDVIQAHKKQFEMLKSLTDKAIEVLKKDPQEYYKHVKHYLQDISYETFIQTLTKIEWINTTLDEVMKKRLHQIAFPLSGLI